MIRAGAVALASLFVVAAPARAERVIDRAQRYRLELPAGFKPATGALPEGVLASYRDRDAGAIVSIARIELANTAAWRGKDDYFARVESGARAGSRGYKRIARRRHKLGKVPALDLWFERDTDGGRKRIGTRFVFFRRYTLILTVTVAAAGANKRRDRIDALVESFEPEL